MNELKDKSNAALYNAVREILDKADSRPTEPEPSQEEVLEHDEE